MPVIENRMDLWRRRWFWGAGLSLLLWAVMALLPRLLGASPRALAYSEMRKAIAAGQVKEVTLDGAHIRGTMNAQPEGWHGVDFVTVRVDDPSLVDALVAADVKVTGVAPSGFWAHAAGWTLPVIFSALLLVPLLSMLRKGSPLAIGKSRARVAVEAKTGVSFADVAGVDEAKEELQEVVDFLRTPDKFKRLGGRLPKGILLVGPPGTGKTLLARAVAGQAQVPFFNISGSEFVELFVGVGAARVRDLFQQAKASAPCIIFIDELDALGKVRGAGPLAHEEREQTLNQLLVELDGFDPREGVVLMAATNRPEILDAALLRAGRFDRQVLVDRPDQKGRLQILQVHAAKVRLAEPKDLERVATLTPGLAGADLANIVNEAALLAVRRNHDAVLRDDFDEAVERVVAGLAKHNRVLTPEERERVAFHEVGHALVALSIPGGGVVQKISIIPRGVSAVGYTFNAPLEDRRVLSKPELEAKLAVMLGGRAAEFLELGSASTGAEDDIGRATQLARAMVRVYGMSEALGPIRYEHDRQSPYAGGLGREYGEDIAREIDREVQGLIEHSERAALAALSAKRGALQAVARTLLERETLTGEELLALIAAQDAKQAA